MKRCKGAKGPLTSLFTMLVFAALISIMIESRAKERGIKQLLSALK